MILHILSAILSLYNLYSVIQANKLRRKAIKAIDEANELATIADQVKNSYSKYYVIVTNPESRTGKEREEILKLCEPLQLSHTAKLN